MRSRKGDISMKIKRRLALGAVALGSMGAALTIADPAAAGPRTRTYHSEAAFELECKFLDWEFYRDSRTGRTYCARSDGGITECGTRWKSPKNCTVWPAKPGKPSTINHDETAGRTSNSPQQPTNQPSSGRTTTGTHRSEP
jgi:hypothetical protein